MISALRIRYHDTSCMHRRVLSEGGKQRREGADSCFKTIGVDRQPHWSTCCFKEKKNSLTSLQYCGSDFIAVRTCHLITWLIHSFIQPAFIEHPLYARHFWVLETQVNEAESLPSWSSPYTFLICCALTPVITHFSGNVPVLSMSQVVLPPFVQLRLVHTVHSYRSPKAGRILVSCLLVKCWCYDSYYSTVAFRMLTLKIRTRFICWLVFVYIGASII